MLEPVPPEHLDTVILNEIRLSLDIRACPACQREVSEPRLVPLPLLAMLRRGGNWTDLQTCRRCQTVWVLRMRAMSDKTDELPTVWLFAYREVRKTREFAETVYPLGPLLDDGEETRNEPKDALDPCPCCGLREDAAISPHTLIFPRDLAFLRDWRLANTKKAGARRQWLRRYYQQNHPPYRPASWW